MPVWVSLALQQCSSFSNVRFLSVQTTERRFMLEQEDQLCTREMQATLQSAWQHIEGAVQGAASLNRYKGLHAALQLLKNQVLAVCAEEGR